MEHLTKQQIVLLTLLVSFVSSIATGIVTVSLLDQAPPAVTQTVNRIVERTIEKAVTAATTTPIITKETIVVKEDEAIVAAAMKVSQSLVHIYGQPVESSVTENLGLGITVSSKGLIVARAFTDGRTRFSAELQGGNTVSITLLGKTDGGLALFQADQSTDPKDVRAYSAVPVGDSDILDLGQSVVVVGGATDPVVSTGILSSVIRDGAPLPTGDRQVTLLKTNVLDQELASLSVLVNLRGEAIGWKTGSTRDDGYIPANIIRKAFPGSI
jgi:S1-C subfamily serine protease